MPTAPLRPCPEPQCPILTRGGPCPEHARQREQRRGTASARGYNQSWVRFRPTFIAALVDAGILPVCGAALPTGPKPTASQCHAQGVSTFTSADGSSLHLDHEPALDDWERRDPARVCQMDRIVLLCQACHAAKTLAEARNR